MSFVERVRGALTLNAATFEEIEAGPSANGQAFLIVVAYSLATGIGGGGFGDVPAMLRGTLTSLVLWVLWAAVTYIVGTRLLPDPQTRTDMGELLRVFGFSSAPWLFGVLGGVPVVGELVWMVAAVWVLAATVIGVRQALDYTSTLRALCVVLVGWVVVTPIRWLILR